MKSQEVWQRFAIPNMPLAATPPRFENLGYPLPGYRAINNSEYRTENCKPRTENL